MLGLSLQAVGEGGQDVLMHIYHDTSTSKLSGNYKLSTSSSEEGTFAC